MTDTNSGLLSEESKEPQADKVRVHFDDVLKELGQFGPYQRKIYFLLFMPTIFSAMHKLAWVFLGAKVGHRCRLDQDNENSTYQLGQGMCLLCS